MSTESVRARLGATMKAEPGPHYSELFAHAPTDLAAALKVIEAATVIKNEFLDPLADVGHYSMEQVVAALDAWEALP